MIVLGIESTCDETAAALVEDGRHLLSNVISTSVKEQALYGGVDGLDFYRAICENWRGALRPGGRLYFEVGIGQADDVLRIMRAVGFGDIEVIPDLNGIPRVVWGILHTEI